MYKYKIDGIDIVNSSWCTLFSIKAAVFKSTWRCEFIRSREQRYRVQTLTLLRPSVMLTSAEISACFYRKKQTRKDEVAPRRKNPFQSYLFSVESRWPHLSVKFLDQSHIPWLGVHPKILPGPLLKGQPVSHRVLLWVCAIKCVHMCSYINKNTKIKRVFISINAAMNDAIDAFIPRQKQKWKRGKVHRLGDMIPVITHQGVQGGNGRWESGLWVICSYSSAPY